MSHLPGGWGRQAGAARRPGEGRQLPGARLDLTMNGATPGGRAGLNAAAVTVEPQNLKEKPLLRIVVGALCSLLIGLPALAAPADPVVRTDKGLVRGKADAGVKVFLGVPFAQPPVGNLRWRDPQALEAWSGVREAKAFSRTCVQEPPAPSQNQTPPSGPYTAEFMSPPEMSEDCLYLNVWTPKSSSRGRPVLVFIHGGAFQAGSTSVPVYDGAHLARRDVVVVTLNYRLGVFGYLAHPELTKESPLGTSGNYGLLDAVAALRWVRDNISAFGGDPENVTIAGQSAGAIIVNQLLASPPAKGLFHRAIAESGPTLGLRMRPLDAAERGGEAFVQRMKVASVDQLRALPTNEVFTGFRGPANPMPPFFPLPVMDGKVVVADPEIPTNPIVSNVPLLVGFNRDETETLPTTATKFVTKVKAQYSAFADRILALYPHATDDEASRSAVALARESQMAGLLYWAEARASTQHEQVYVYWFQRPYPGVDPERFGSFHTAEVPFVFGTLPAKATAEDRRVSDQVQKRWIAFMKKGDPSVSGDAWSDIARAPGRPTRLGDTPRTTPPASSQARLDLLRQYFGENGLRKLF